MDSGANLYLFDTGGNRVLKTAMGSPTVLNLGYQTPNTTGAAQTVTLVNTGNSTLNLSNISVSTSFVLDSTTSSACTATTTLSPGKTCTLSVAFSPAAGANGPITGALTITDNTLNVTSAIQTIPLTGTAQNLSTTQVSLSTSSASPIYGSTYTVTATIAGGSTPTGNMKLSVNGIPGQSVALNPSGSASITLTAVAAGTTVVTAAYSGDQNNASASTKTTITVQPVMLTVTAANATIAYAAPLPPLTYTITGYVNGDTSSVVSGAPAETTTATSSSAAGNYPITVTQGTLAAANYTFAFVSGKLTIQPPPSPDYTFSATPATQSVAAGGIAVYTLTVTPEYGYAGIPTLSCSGLPQNASCSFTGPFVAATAGGPAWTQVQIGISKASTASAAVDNISGGGPQVWTALGMPLCCLGILMGARKRKWTSKLLGFAALTILAAGATSCSGNGGSGSPTVIPSGTYQVVVSANDASANLSHSTTLTLTIQ